MYCINTSKIVFDLGAIYWKNTVAFFLLSKKVITNIEKPEQIGPVSCALTLTQHESQNMKRSTNVVTI